MYWRRFLVFNPAGRHRLVGDDVALPIVGVAVIVAVSVFPRRNEARLPHDADRTMPGPLEPTR